MQKQRMMRFVSALLSLVMMLTLMMVPSKTAYAEEDGVAAFVTRCYQVTLGREPDETGFADWTGRLRNGQICGSDVAFGFVFSNEYTNAGKSNGEYVTDMYTLFLDRAPDEDGYNDWVGRLDAGEDRMNIFNGFANSIEFFNICVGYGVTAGAFSADYDHAQVNNVNMFVARLYNVCFNRLGDQGGQADWVGKLLRHELTGIECANNFINSQEYQNLGLSNEDYVRNMYRACMGREADEGGFNDWVSKLNAGYTRDEIFAGFANSLEFKEICENYGISQGTYAPTNVHTGDAAPSGQRWRPTKVTHADGSYTLYTYNDGEFAKKQMRYHADGSEWAIEYLEKANEDGSKQVMKNIFSYDSVLPDYLTIETKNRTDMSYDMVTTRKNDDGTQVYEVKTEHYQKYAGKGFLLMSNETYNAYSNSTYTQTYTRDQYGNVLVYNYDMPDINMKEIHNYTYDNQGRVVQDIMQTVRNAAGDAYFDKYVYQYSADGKTVRQMVYYNVSEDGTPKNGDSHIDTVSTYNDQGLLVKEEVFSVYQDKETLSESYENLYDANGNMTQTTHTTYGSAHDAETVHTEVETTEYEAY